MLSARLGAGTEESIRCVTRAGAVPGSNALTAVLSGALLQLDGVWGFAGWKWLFVLEAIPSIILAFVVLAVMTDRPALATWLKPEERKWLETELEKERVTLEASHGSLTLFQALTDRRVIALSFIYMTIVTATYGITFFLPLIVKGAGFSDAVTGLVTAIPYVVGTVGMVLWSFSSDRRKERRWHFIIACIVAATGLLAAGWLGTSYWALAAMSVATVGLYGSKPAFWPLPSEFLSGRVRRRYRLVNSIGNLGGFAGPYAVGWLKIHWNVSGDSSGR
jgi:ACS family tartrate transporter-like MFS transporter